MTDSQIHKSAANIETLYESTPSERDIGLRNMLLHFRQAMMHDFLYRYFIIVQEQRDASYLDVLQSIAGEMIRDQKTVCNVANLTDEQSEHFVSYFDNSISDAVLILCDLATTMGVEDRIAFQTVAHEKLGLIA